MLEKKLTELKQDKINRAIDANLNRLREGLRVCEDIVRFVAGDAKTTEGFKRIRYRIRQAVDLLAIRKPEILKFRDTLSDVGKRDFIDKTKIRVSSYQDILIANIQRAQEAARSLEEFSKLKNKAASKRFKNIRFSLYALEKKIFGKDKTLEALRNIR